MARHFYRRRSCMERDLDTAASVEVEPLAVRGQWPTPEGTLRWSSNLLLGESNGFPHLGFHAGTPRWVSPATAAHR